MPREVIRHGVFGTVSNMLTFTSVDIGERLMYERKKNRYTIQQLSKELNVSEEAILAWENSLSLPANKFVQKLAKLYDVSENYLLGNEDINDKGDIR